MLTFLQYKQSTQLNGDALINGWSEYVKTQHTAALTELSTLPTEATATATLKALRKSIRGANYSALCEALTTVQNAQETASRLEFVESIAHFHNDSYEPYGDVYLDKLNTIETIINNRLNLIESRVRVRAHRGMVIVRRK
jgi:hypothetical protein